MKRSEINEVHFEVRLVRRSFMEKKHVVEVAKTKREIVVLDSKPPISESDIDELRRTLGELMDFITYYLCY